MSVPFVHKRKIRFSHCDPTGILYFTHVFDFVNAAVEDWFDTGLGMPFHEFHMHHRLGNPVVSTDCAFMHACRFGEEIALELSPTRIGHSSMEISIAVKVGGEERMRLRHKTAMISLDHFRAIEIPPELRARAMDFLAPELRQEPALHALHLAKAPPPEAFCSRQLVRYFHCDPGGIVYFPRFFEMFNAVLEDWFAEALDCPWGTDLMGARKLSIPTLAIRVEFLRASRLGETLAFALWPTRLGRSSISLALIGSVGDAERLRATWTVCMVSSEGFRSVPIPDDLRERMQSFVSAGT
jgi:4-hydroxybenzoyl-CoA thioesterase